MYEINGRIYTLQQLEQAAENYGMDFDSYFARMQEKGLKEAENFQKGIVKHTNSSYFTFVAIDKEGKPVKVPGLELLTDTEIRRFAFGKLRKEQKSTNNKEFDELKSSINLNTVHQKWKNENCKVV